MPLTRDFRETTRARAVRDPKFRRALLREGVEAMLAGDVAAAKTILRELVQGEQFSLNDGAVSVISYLVWSTLSTLRNLLCRYSPSPPIRKK
jgi:hypothetical protein